MPTRGLSIQSTLLWQPQLVAALPEGFKNLVQEAQVPRDMLEVLIRMSSDPLLSATAATYPRVPSYLIQVRSVPVLKSCSSFYISDTIEHASFEKLLCNGLIRYCADAANSTLFNVINAGRRRELIHKLPNVDCSRLTITKLNCLIWLWLVAIESRRAWRVIAPGGRLLLGALRQHFPHVAAWSPADLDKLCYKFFWTKDFSLRARSFWGSGQSK